MTHDLTSTYAGELTPDHLRLIADARDQWMAAGLSTERADRPACEAAVREAYTAAGLPEPALIVWMDSPLGGLYASAVIRQILDKAPDQLWGQLWGQLGGQLRDQLGGQLWGQLGGQLWGQLGDQLGGQLWGQLGDQLGGQLRDQLGGQLGDQLRGQLGGQLRDQLGDQLRGQLWDQLGDQLSYTLDPWYEAYWMAFYQSGLQIAGLPASDRLDPLVRATSGMGWWWPQQGIAILTDRPTVIARDGQARLHCEDGPALAYADGYSMWSWHGTRVSQDLIETGWDTTRILREENTEIRRCAIEHLGWGQFVRDAGLAQVGETVPDPGNPGHLLALYDVPERVYGDMDVRVLLCTNGTVERDGTRRRFGLTVPADIPDPLSAAAWTFGLDATTYATAQRRS